ncbi:hypothetical protein LJR130_003504 [Variovorax sp. LjRoot130]|uniref:hypothetical protein n=1 Tax=Variovorax sp. LjRoot130 TaxID=3342261 RepID=UPI003ED13041
MATNSPAAGDLRPGGVRFSVHDDGRPVSGATCSLYRQLLEDPGSPGTPGTPGKKRPGAPPPSTGRELYVATQVSGRDGQGRFPKQPPGSYFVLCHNQALPDPVYVEVESDCTHEACIELGLHVTATITLLRDDCSPNSLGFGLGREGDVIEIRIDYTDSATRVLPVQHPARARIDPNNPLVSHLTIPSAGLHELRFGVAAPYIAGSPGAPAQGGDARISGVTTIDAGERTPQPVSGNLGVALQRTATVSTADLSFWQGILNSTEQMSFNNYLRFMNMLFCGDNDLSDLPDFEQERFGQKRILRDQLRFRRLLPFTDSDAYRAVKAATEAFVMVNCGVLAPRRPFDEERDLAYLQRRDLPGPIGRIEDVFTEDYLVQILGGEAGDKTLPYLAVIRSKLPDIAIKLNPIDVDPDRVGQCTGILQDKLANPCLLELIWSYWHEEGMLVQTMNSITRRFQNVRSHERDPLANLEIDPLRPLNNVLWGFVQDEQHRLSIVRRNYEYDHHYGLRLEGKAVQRMQAADSRSRFLEAFHNLLRQCTTFYKQDDDTTVKADAFPVLNALKEVHLILSQGAHNQFGDLPSTARIEMMMEQWILARPEFREFLPTRIMTAYPEPWMDRVDAMKKVQGWTDTSVLHFRNLAIFGEQVLLSIRWGHWSDVQDPLQAFNWARFFRPQIQGYSHAYRSVTGVDLTLELPDAKVDATLPSVLLQRRLATQQRAA